VSSNDVTDARGCDYYGQKCFKLRCKFKTNLQKETRHGTFRDILDNDILKVPDLATGIFKLCRSGVKIKEHESHFRLRQIGTDSGVIFGDAAAL
jgi:hypothetical protein